MSARQLIIIGSGGFGQEAIWVAESMNETLPVAERWHILGYLDDLPNRQGSELYGYPVLGPLERGAVPGECWYYCAIGQNTTRESVSQRVDAFGWKPATLVHSSVIRAKYTTVGAGTFIGPGSILSPNARVGQHVIINQRVSIGHDATLDDFSQACPGAQINGNCKVGRGAMIGSNSSILQGKSIGDHAVVAANSQVVTHVGANTSVCGVPAMRIAAGRE